MGGVRVHWQEQRSHRATQVIQNSWMSQTPGMMTISMWWAPISKISRYFYFMVTIFENKDATTRYAGEADGQTLVETAGSPGRDTSAGHMKLDNV